MANKKGKSKTISDGMKEYHRKRRERKARKAEATRGIAITRDDKGRYKTGGESNHPAVVSARSLRSAIMDKTHDLEDVLDVVYKMLNSNINNAQHNSNRKFAIEWLTNYGIGRPKAEVESTNTLNITIGQAIAKEDVWMEGTPEVKLIETPKGDKD